MVSQVTDEHALDVVGLLFLVCLLIIIITLNFEGHETRGFKTGDAQCNVEVTERVEEQSLDGGVQFHVHLIDLLITLINYRISLNVFYKDRECHWQKVLDGEWRRNLEVLKGDELRLLCVEVNETSYTVHVCI